MDNYIVIKNGLVLTLDRKSQSGYFNIIIRNNRIFFIDTDNAFNENEFVRKNPEAQIIDARNKLIMPGFFNSKLVSSYSFNKVFFRKCNYENLSSWLSLKLIDNFLSKTENHGMFRDLLRISSQRSVLNGEIFINESSGCIRKNFYDEFERWSPEQLYSVTLYDHSILPEDKNKVSFGLKIEDQLNNYSLSSLKKNLSGTNVRIIIEASMSQNEMSSIKDDFGKPLINVLSEMELLNSNTVISNPNHISHVELETLKKKKCSLLISPSDYVNLSAGKVDIDELILSGLNVVTGTGYTGNDILSELKTFHSVLTKGVINSEDLLKTAVTNAAQVFGLSNMNGSIERNKSADLIFFDLNSFRNVPFIPEPDSENVCEFIIQNLYSKDISEVMIEGEMLVQDKKLSKGIDAQRAEEISAKLYVEGKFFEYKEKYLMRGRVDKLTEPDETGEEPKPEIYVDMTETGQYEGEGEFTILGAKEEEFDQPREKTEREPKIKLKEIKSLDGGLNLFDDDQNEDVISVRHSEKKTEEVTEEEDTSHREIEAEPKEKKHEKKHEPVRIKEETEKPEFKKVKLKFGFKEDE